MYNHRSIEKKWQEKWSKNKTFQPDLETSRKPFYNLMMFPYPSAEGLHVGHTYAFGGADAYGRFKRLQGHTVFEPMGWDAFGIHSENFAIKKNLHPKDLIEKTTTYFREKQMKRYGGMWDWSRQVDTTKPDYYKWTQWIFVTFFKNGLVERKKTPLNWCPSCKTVLSDEQVEPKEGENVCERCKTLVERKETEQWFFKITQYAQKLLSYHDTTWPKTTREMQTNWIGRKEGINIKYKIVSETTPPRCPKDSSDGGASEKLTITCFTTRPDTNFGATFVVLAPEHPLVSKILNPKSEIRNKFKIQTSKLPKIKAYVEKAKQKSELERIAEGRAKTGVFTGLYAINDLTGKKMPIWVTDFVLMNVGTGAVVGVPGHDLRDFEFAKKYKLPIIRVVVGSNGDKSPITRADQVQEDEGTMINSDFLNDLDIHEATQKIMDYIEKKGQGKRTISYRLRDWCISRQRYWGPPIPMIYCKSCAKEGKSSLSTGEMPGWYPVPEKDLPVKLPFIKDYQPKGKGKSPLAEVKSFYQVKCPHCHQSARRETDVSDTFLDSAWYFLRYPSTEFGKAPFDPKRTKKWLPVDMYIGGNEHACLHLLYCRFVTHALHDLGYLPFEEPFKRFHAHGLIIKDGAKMSKSRGNVINPEEYMDKYGADALRMYLLFLGPIEQGGDFRDTGMAGMHRFLKRLYQLARDSAKNKGKLNRSLAQKLHQTIKKVGEDLEKLRFNTAIAALMELTNTWQTERETANKELVGVVARLIAPFAPHLAEEFWQMGGGKFRPEDDRPLDGSVLDAGWPKYDPQLVKEEKATIVVQVNGRLRDTLKVKLAQSKDRKTVLKLVQSSVKVQKYLQGQKIKKTIFVPGKLVNFVA